MKSNIGSAQERLGALSPGKAKLLELFLQKDAKQPQAIKPYSRECGDDRARLPASGAQHRLWFIDQLESGSKAYHIPLAIRLRGALDRATLQAALDALIRRHETLRTVFTKVNGGLVQEIVPARSFALQVVSLRSVAAPDRESAMSRHSREALTAPFDLSAGPLIRGRLLQISESDHFLLVIMHHMISDGWSLDVFVRELTALYAAYREGSAENLPALPIQYADYAQWQREWLKGTELQEQLAYWKEHLHSAPELLELPTDRPRPPTQSYDGASVRVSLGADLTADIKALARRLNLTLAMTLFTAWSILLSRLSGQTNIVVGMPVANRRRTELEGLIGLFVNTLAVRVQLEDDPTGADLLQRVKQTMLGAYAHQETPFEQVVEALQPSRVLSYSPIFQVMFVLRNAARGEMQLPDLTLTEEEVPLHAAQFDVSLSLQESANGIFGSVTYATDLFDASTVERWVACFQCVLQGLVREPERQVSKLRILSEAERHRIVALLNATLLPFEQETLIHELFEQQVERTPHSMAVVYEGQSVTYTELNDRANQLAWYLRERGVAPDQLVGICVERSLEMVIGLLGILKAGGAYVPLDPNYPAQRLAHMVEDASPQVLLVQEPLRERLPSVAAKVIALDRDWGEIAQQPRRNLDARMFGLRSRHLAYVIYTSGSTGQPKGAMNEHRSLINRLQWMQREYELNESDRVLQKTPFSFDVSVWEFFWTLMSGARLIVARPEGHKDPDYLRTVIEASGVTTLHFVPSMLQVFLDSHASGRCSSIDHIVCSGEELPQALQNKCFACLPLARLSNLYGPTEAAVDVTFWECQPDARSSRVPIGQPVANTQMYVLDGHLEPVPIGVAGEIYIGGVQVGRGYLNRPELTAQRFIADPLSADPKARMYKTGDVGRWRADGAIEYLGRNDHQVKIRGFRIELGEIEARLLSHEQVKEAVVIAREDVSGEKRLVAYVVPRNQLDPATAPGIDDLRTYLKVALPAHMMPSAFVMLDRLPLSPNGKLDRRALPAPELDSYARRQYEPPLNEVEEIVAGIWQGLLRVERVGRQDNFFELGGHSLLLVQVMERLRRVGLSAELRQVFESPTLAGLASTLTAGPAAQSQVPPNLIPLGCDTITGEMLPLVQLQTGHIEQIVNAVPGGASNIQDIYPLAPLQEGILFHHLLSERGGDTYVVPTLLAVSSRERLDELIAALQVVIDRHDVLRTAVLWEHLPRPVQVVYRHASLPVEEIVLDPDGDPQEQVTDWMRPGRQRLDLRRAPLIRLQVAADTRTTQWFVLLQMHHIVGDNTSREIVTSEVIAQLEGRAQQLPASIPYRNHVAQALAYEGTRDAEAFFRSKLGQIDEPTAPFGLTDVHGDGSLIDEAHEELDAVLAQRVRAQARNFGVSAATLFHATWGLVVAHTSGREDVVFGTVLLGRLHGDAGAQRIFGMFINTLPLRLQLQGLTAKELVESTQRELVELLIHEQASLAVAQRCSGIAGSVPLFTALFNYRHSAPNLNAEWSHASGVRVLGGRERTNYPIVVSVDDMGDRFRLSAQTDQRIDPSRIAAYLRTAVESLVEALERKPETSALALSILPEDERRQVIKLFNATYRPYPQDKLIHELFEERVERTPNSIAAVYEQQVLTYAELNAKANQLARYLREQGVAAGDYIPILMRRSLQMLIAQIAVLKCGGVYVPVDPELPIERRAFIVRDCAAPAILAVGESPDEAALACRRWIDCAAAAVTIESHRAENLNLRMTSISPAYVMYTSGSTGVPKGVVVPHRAVNHLAVNGFVPLEPEDCLAHYSNPAFDASTLEIWGALLNGARVVVVPQPAVLDAERFAEILKSQGVTTLYMSVGLFNQYSGPLARVFERLRYLMVGGDALEPGAIGRVLSNRPPQQLLNVYGPTECTSISTSYRIKSVEEGATSLPIGCPVANGHIYILSSGLQPVPIGVAGEIYIGGAGVACGYLNRPELTSERFVPDPFSAEPHARLYKTGDLARWRADGVIEFLGRNDHQVKIRGFRIELGEIEAQLARIEQVQEAIVLARMDVPGEKRLVAYVTSRDPSNVPPVEDLRACLRAALPEYMVPTAFVILESMPLTSTGKVNRRALPPPDLGAYGSGVYEAPQGQAEEALATIFRSVLKLSRCGRRDNFFDLGGHSLLALQALVRINEVLGASLRITDLYKSPTVKELAEHVRAGSSEEQFLDLSQEATLDADIIAKPGVLRVPAKAVMLTGATGFVGRFLLAQLLQDTGATVYCLVRASSPHQAMYRLRATLAKWDLWRDELAPRIVAVPGDLRLPRLGIDAPTHRFLCENVDSIYHCGTSMNHLETYAMAKAANVESARALLRLATTGRLKQVNYISTLGVFSYSTSDSARSVDEETPIDYEKHSSASGYVASKWIGEKMFMIAAERGVPCNIFRLGLVWADTELGRYDDLQHVYRLFKSCLVSGYGIKNYRHEMPPTPVDYVARAVVFLANRHTDGRGVFHISAASQMAQGWFESCNEIADTSFAMLSHFDWICEMKRLHLEGCSLPVVPLIEPSFSMDEESFEQQQRRNRARSISFECARTHRELEQAGIVAPELDDDLLRRCLEGMLSRDTQLRELTRASGS